MLNIVLRSLSSLKIEGTSGCCMKTRRNSLNKDSSKPCARLLKPCSCPLHLKSLFSPFATSDYCSPYIHCLINCPPPQPEGCRLCHPSQTPSLRDKCSNPPQATPSYDFCHTPCPSPPISGPCITYTQPICNICNPPCTSCPPPCCSHFNPLYSCESPHCYGNYGSCYNPYYSGCPCGQVCANCTSSQQCASAYSPCLANPFAPPESSQSDSAKLSPSVERFTSSQPLRSCCDTCTLEKQSNTMKMDPMPSEDFCFSDYPCSPCCPICPRCNAPCFSPFGIPEKCGRCGHPCPPPCQLSSPCELKKEQKTIPRASIPAYPIYRTKKYKQCVACVPRRKIYESNSKNPTSPVMHPSSHVSVIADCHSFLYDTCKSKPMKYEAESVIIFKHVGKEAISVHEISQYEDCKPTALKDHAEPFHSPIEDILTASEVPREQSLNSNIQEEHYYLPAANPAPSNRSYNGKKHPWVLA